MLKFILINFSVITKLKYIIFYLKIGLDKFKSIIIIFYIGYVYNRCKYNIFFYINHAL